MRVPKRITIRWLRKRIACDSSVYEFKEVFPRGAGLTYENLKLARKKGLNLTWLAKKLGLFCNTALPKRRCAGCGSPAGMADALNLPDSPRALKARRMASARRKAKRAVATKAKSRRMKAR